METLKNFIALLISTVTWFSGLGSIILILIAIFHGDVAALLLGIFLSLLSGVGLFISKHNERVKTALEYPFGFGLV